MTRQVHIAIQTDQDDPTHRRLIAECDTSKTTVDMFGGAELIFAGLTDKQIVRSAFAKNLVEEHIGLCEACTPYTAGETAPMN